MHFIKSYEQEAKSIIVEFQEMTLKAHYFMLVSFKKRMKDDLLFLVGK